MSINMADVKQIMHGAKEVIKIEDSGGNILWQKPGSSTITVGIVAKGDSTFITNNIYVQVSVNGVSTNYSTTTSITVNKSELDYIRIYHKPHSTLYSCYSAVLENGSLADSNSTTTIKYYEIDTTTVNSSLDIEIAAYYYYTPIVSWIIKDNASVSGTCVLWIGSSTGISVGSGYGNAFYTLNRTAQSQTTLTMQKVTISSLTYSAGTSRGSSAYPGVIRVYGDAEYTSTKPTSYYTRVTITSPSSLKYIAAVGKARSSSGSTPVSYYGVIYLMSSEA